MADQKHIQTSHSLKSFLSTVMAVVVAISVILGVGFGIFQLIDNRIEQAINDEQFIRKVAANIRPYVIFDVNESILVDGGAMQALEKIEVEKETGDSPLLPVKVIVTPKYHLAHPPLIDNVGAGSIILAPNPKRGHGHQWIYEFEVKYWQDSETPVCFRLEIVR